MKKYVLLGIITCFALPFTSSCSFFNPSSNIDVSDPKDSTEESASNDTISDSPKYDESDNSESPQSPNEDTNESDNAAESENTSPSDKEDSSYADSSVNADEAETTPDIQTTVGYVLSVDENTMYVDLKNTGSRLYPGEGEDRKVAFDISNAEQVQTNISEFNPATDNFISPGIQVTIEYYVENGMNIATKVTSDGDEKEPYSPVAIGKVNSVSDTELSISVTEGDNIGETITFNLSVCDPISDPISIDSQVAIAYYTKQDINYAIYVGCIS